jgi:hypothetical protein
MRMSYKIDGTLYSDAVYQFVTHTVMPSLSQKIVMGILLSDSNFKLKIRLWKLRIRRMLDYNNQPLSDRELAI